MKNLGRRKRETPIERCSLGPVPRRTLASPLKLAMPGRANTFPKLMQRSEVRGHAVVAVVPAKHAREPVVLSGHRLVPALPHLVAQARELRVPFLP